VNRLDPHGTDWIYDFEGATWYESFSWTEGGAGGFGGDPSACMAYVAVQPSDPNFQGCFGSIAPVVPVQYTPPEIPCSQLLTDAIGGFLGGKGSALAAYASQLVQVGQQDNIDPTLLAAIAIAENGQARNNPFALGPNGSSTYPTLSAAIGAAGSTLDKYIYTWNESTVSALWSGNTWKVDPRKPWITIQPPGYCVGTTAAGIAGCQNTGNAIAGFMKSMGATATVGGNPNKLGFPCPD
jgi:hypothetical protein